MGSIDKFLRTGAWFSCAAVSVGLVACGGSGDPDPLQKYREQTVQWAACDATILGRTSPKIDSLWAEAGDRLRCASVRAPLDWSNPERGDVVISALRMAAGKPEKRRGAMFFNPGGPGGDGLATNLNLFLAFSGSNPSNPQGAQQLRLLDEYDMVGFSPRGTGASTQLHCATNEHARFVEFSASGWDTPANIANAHYNGSKTAEACLKNPITPFINTEATARDMDLLRGLLGDQKLNYVGYSYGTWLGAWYAALFPERVGRMVLDSSTDFSSTMEGILTSQGPVRQRLLDDVMAPYAARHPDYFQLGANEALVRAITPGLSSQVQNVLGIKLSNLGYKRINADQYLFTVSAAKSLDAVLKSLPDPSDEDALEEAIDEHVFDASSRSRDAVIRNIAVELAQIYLARLNPTSTSIILDASESVLHAVHCNDTVATTDLTTWASILRTLAPKAPMFFSGLLDLHTCAFWGGPRVSKPELTPLKPLDILFVQSQYDTATYTEGANNFFAQLPAARRVYVSGDFDHGIYPYSDSCVDPRVTNYLLGESFTQREAVCEGIPFTQDAAKSGVPQAAASAPEPASSASQVYKDPQKARELIEDFKRGILPPNLRR